MIKFYSNYFKKEDPRGKIVGLINQGNWEELNYFCTDSDQIRGNHYHKKTDELFIILKGKLEIQLTEVSQNGELEGRTESFFIKKPDTKDAKPKNKARNIGRSISETGIR